MATSTRLRVGSSGKIFLIFMCGAVDGEWVESPPPPWPSGRVGIPVHSHKRRETGKPIGILKVERREKYQHVFLTLQLSLGFSSAFAVGEDGERERRMGVQQTCRDAGQATSELD